MILYICRLILRQVQILINVLKLFLVSESSSFKNIFHSSFGFFFSFLFFQNKCNVGYAFINMINPQHIIPFYQVYYLCTITSSNDIRLHALWLLVTLDGCAEVQTFNGKKWEKFNSEKVASLAYARIQGKAALIAHFQNSSLMNEDKRCRPILFHSEGPNAGDQVLFLTYYSPERTSWILYNILFRVLTQKEVRRFS